MISNKIGIIGIGNMGEAILKSILNNDIIEQHNILLSETKKDRADFIKKTYNIRIAKHPDELAKLSKYIIVAVKPQDSKTLLNDISQSITDENIIISIMAGITISNIAEAIGKSVKIIRLMPNICVKVGEGIIGLTCNSLVENNELEDVQRILAPLGKIIETGEEMMNAITAMGGSGPAFFLLFLEAMIDAGVKMGIPREKSSLISFQVVRGTLRMLEEERLHPTVLKEMIVSPGGTTISGLAHLEEKAFKGNIIKAVEKATKRAKELSL
ncbi:MAG TPA: pyrroline-5-carboxylate reductase [Syntrophorhabdaceae bacterium]|nr:pyrroline-5-carboxylate reductase [Syntrophorhabdaceae bacterium]